jgi:CRISPR/Cas system-associated protein Cas5 (RAMP superfamily)
MCLNVLKCICYMFRWIMFNWSLLTFIQSIKVVYFNSYSSCMNITLYSTFHIVTYCVDNTWAQVYIQFNNYILLHYNIDLKQVLLFSPWSIHMPYQYKFWIWTFHLIFIVVIIIIFLIKKVKVILLLIYIL